MACRQLRHVASSDALWKPLVERDFPRMVSPERRGGWKALYGACVREQEERRRRLRRALPRLQPFHRGNPFVPAPPPGFIVGAL